jgi:hypothetical protein
VLLTATGALPLPLPPPSRTDATIAAAEAVLVDNAVTAGDARARLPLR